MNTKNNRLQFASDEQKTKYINEIIGYFRSERNETNGIIAATSFLDVFLKLVGDDIYSKAIKDCQKMLKERFEDLDVELTSINPNA